MPRRMTGTILAHFAALAAFAAGALTLTALAPVTPAAALETGKHAAALGAVEAALVALPAPFQATNWEYLAATFAAVSALTLAVVPKSRRGAEADPAIAMVLRPARRLRHEMQAILTAMRSMVVEVDLDGRLLRVVRTAYPAEGFDPARLAGKNIARLLDEKDLAAVWRALACAGKERGVQHVDFSTDFGRVRRHFSATLTPLAGRSVLAVVRDVTPMKNSEERYREIVELTNCIILRLDRSGRITFANEFAQRFFGFSREELVGKSALETILPPVDSAGRDLAGFFHAVCARPERYPESENENLRKNGERVFVSWANRPILENGVVTGVLCVGGDITRQRRAMDELVRRERFHGSIIEKSTDIITIVDAQGRILHESPSAAKRLGLGIEETAGTLFEKHMHPDDRTMFGGILRAVAANPGDSPSFEFRRFRRDGSLLSLEATATNCLSDDAVSGIILNCRDVTDRKAFEEQLKRHVFLDALTGLPNRALFLDRLTHAIERIKRKQGYQFAVLFVDVDRFKVINDSLGHSVGDRLLTRIGRRIAECLRRVDTVARFGGDEFILLLDEIDDDRQAIRVAERIRESLARPFAMDEAEVFASASIGIVYSTPDYTDPDQIVRDADTAMFKAKARGKGGYRVFHSRMHKQAVSLLALETDLRKAVERHEFEVHYQPILSLAPSLIVGVEALVRWRHPTRGLIAPMEFVPMAEETGLIVDIGGFVLAEACRRVAAFNAQAGPKETLFVSVNLSVRQFDHEGLVDDIRRVLADTGMAPELLKLEVTESAIAANPGQAALLLESLRELGVGLSMDDFGTGYSSLSHLHAFPFDTLKIDRSFISGLGQIGDKNGKIVHSILALAKNLDMSVIAEGIETDVQWERLVDMDCRLGQGYRFARPGPFESVVDGAAARSSSPDTPDPDTHSRTLP
ncbi:EAL domain-containing protein [Desulfovibrio sulfodismutans]|uniref:EAL domain-containing protein n=1 Tax=Desulfolutivibrio sulfodismutans TaxID=63561 RepID=A0A7K3NLV4_9BACT|nr:bifunctional diguanylate cyclase/phosphodiesterase [Desulfolutivibrio sulfodismutans]NDY57168.1 EAL domain-containing protein [Desulfolutivibrio sulfodismutans]